MVDDPKQIADEYAAGIQLEPVSFDDPNARSPLANGLPAREQFATAKVNKTAQSPNERHAEPSAAIDPDATVTASKIEITLPDGSSIRVGHDVSLVTLRRVVSVLRG